MMSKGNNCANGISERESTNQPDCEDHRDIGHTLANPPASLSSRQTTTGGPPSRVPNSAQAVFCRRRHQARRPPQANIRPGSPAPTTGPGTRLNDMGPWTKFALCMPGENSPEFGEPQSGRLQININAPPPGGTNSLPGSLLK
jgi:hypothetical protein